MVDDLLSVSAPYSDITKTMQAKRPVFLFKSTMHESFRDRYFHLAPRSMFSALNAKLKKDPRHVLKLADNPPGHLDSFSTTSDFIVAHRSHQESITAADPQHYSSSQIAFLCRLKQGVKSDVPKFVFLERSFDLKIRSETINSSTIDSLIFTELEALDNPTPKVAAFSADWSKKEKNNSNTDYRLGWLAWRGLQIQLLRTWQPCRRHLQLQI